MNTFIAAFLILVYMAAPAAAKENPMGTHVEKATFAGGCFWCMQPFFDRMKGVKGTLVGYIGGKTVNPTYEDISTGQTGHAEAIEVTYDPAEVAYADLLDIYWRNIDPTVVDQQFVDYGSQYRTAIFYHSEDQKKQAEVSKQALGSSGRFDKPIVTEIVPATTFYPAEEYHQQYYKKSAFRYKLYHDNSGRDEFLKKTWAK